MNHVRSIVGILMSAFLVPTGPAHSEGAGQALLEGLGPACSVQVGDADGDGRSELQVWESGNLAIRDAAGNLLRAVRPDVPEGAYFHGEADVDGDGRREFLFAVATLEEARLILCDAQGRRLRCYAMPARAWRGRPGGGLGFVWAGDLDGDGQRELVVQASAGYALKPRGIACFAAASGERKWFHETGPGPTTVLVGDFDADGRLEILAGSYAPANGNAAPDGSNDRHSDVWVIGPDGACRRRFGMGGHFTGANLVAADLEGNGRATVAVWTSAAHHHRADLGALYRLDLGEGPQARLDLGVSVRSACRVPSGKGPSERLAVGDRKGTVRLLGEGLSTLCSRVLRESPFDSTPVQVLGAADFTGDGVPEIVVDVWEEDPKRVSVGEIDGIRSEIHVHRRKVLLLDDRLRTVGELPLIRFAKEAPSIQPLIILAGPGHAASLGLLEPGRLTRIPAAELLARVAPAPVDAAIVRQWVRKLADPDWETREKATEALLGFGEPARKILEDERSRTEDPEALARLERIRDLIF